MDLNQYLSIFIEESKEHLQAMNEQLMLLEANPQDAGTVQSIFRSAHTMKGMSATMGYTDMTALTHDMENILDLIRNHKISVNSSIIDCLLSCLDELENMIDDIQNGGNGDADVSEIIAMLKSIAAGEPVEPKSVKQPKPENANPYGLTDGLDQYQFSVAQQSLDMGQSVYFIEIVLRDGCILKAARAYMVFNALDAHGEIVKSIPIVEEIEQEKFDKVFWVYYISKLEQTQLHQLIMGISEIESVHITQVDFELLQQMSHDVQHAAGPNEAEPTDATQEHVAVKPDQQAAALLPKSNSSKPSRTIRVEVERLDILMNLFSELLVNRARLEQLSAEIDHEPLIETVAQMSRISGELQSVALNLRMVPVESVFNRFPRMIRDLAKSLDKHVELVISGAETELDRNVIDEIGEPLVHLLRNSMDHGIESPSERKAAGKPEIGTIRLSAFHFGNHIFIEIEDDGRGIHRDKVLAKAVKNNLVSADEANRMTDEEVYRLLFASGFSTADKISDVSGRGVGLDAAGNKVSALGGRIHVESAYGRGTKFTVQLPLTLSIISAMMVKLGEERYAVPLSSIVETLMITRKKIKQVQGSTMMEYQGRLIPVISLSKLIDCPTFSDQNEDESEIIIIRKGEKVGALLIDDFIGQQEIVIKPLGEYLERLLFFSGATIIGDGSVALIFDVNALME